MKVMSQGLINPFLGTKKREGDGVGGGGVGFRPLRLEKTGSLQSPQLTYKVLTP